MIRKTFLTAIFLSALFWACKKEENNTPATPSTSADVRDSAYFVATELYLWRDNLPTIDKFIPKNYTDANAVLTQIRGLSPAKTTGGNFDRWSFAMKKTEWDNYASGNNGDFGCGFSFLSGNDLRVRYVYAKSSAGQAGIERGWKVLKINGVEASTANATALNTELAKDKISLVVEKADATQSTIDLSKSSYQTNPVLMQKVIKEGTKTIGYLAFNSFLGTTASADLNNAFTFFKNNNVSDLVIDLRYNGGGYVSLAEQMANLVVSNNARGKLMYKDSHNSKYATLDPKNFYYRYGIRDNTVNYAATAPANALALSRLVVIATGSSASASELFINVLEPYTDVKIIGSTTYGKPAGYYGIPVMDHYSFPLAVRQVNANGYGDFYEGLKADKTQKDDLARNWGDPEEACLKDALSYFRTGALPASLPAQERARIEALEPFNQLFDKDSFKGMIFR